MDSPLAALAVLIASILITAGLFALPALFRRKESGERCRICGDPDDLH